MIHQPPAGARDLLPLEVTQKSWINDQLQSVFQRWGYQRIVTSTLEWIDTLAAGGAIDSKTVVQLSNGLERPLGLRPELTASIARAAVTRMSDKTYPQRLCYRANVFRHPAAGHYGKQLEFFQSGVELLFAGGILADTEILLLIVDCLDQLKIDKWKLVLGDASLTRSLLNLFPPSLRQEIRNFFVSLDRLQLERIDFDSEELRQLALEIFDLRGEPYKVLDRASKLPLDSAGKKGIENLKLLLDCHLNKIHTDELPFVLDLSLFQPFDYYTGIIFQIVQIDDSGLRILGQGGRYDQLLELYHPQKIPAPGIGFSLNIEELHHSLLNKGTLPQTTPPSDWLVVPQDINAEAAAFIYAQKIRKSQDSIRVEIDLTRSEADQIREYASTCRITNIAWVSDKGTPIIERI
jgi:ATP phosphoribosyltransferase regulatory subunit